MEQKTDYIKVASHEGHPEPGDKVLLLFSGGLDTSVILKWLQETYSVDVVTLTVDIGQMSDDVEEVKAKAIKLGAVEAIVDNCQQEFAEQVISKAIKANADYQGGYHLLTPLGRVTISEKAVEYASKLGIKYVAHGCTGKGNDQVRFETYITALHPEIKTIAPVREWSMGRDEQIEFAKKHDVPVMQTKKKPYSYDDNMWGNSAEGGEIEDPALEAPLDNILKVCATPEQAPDEAEYVEVQFNEGVPVAMNGKELPLHTLIAELDEIGAKHGVGVTQLIEDRFVGMKVRGIFEQPAAAILIDAHYNLEKIVCTRNENEFKAMIDQKWAYLCYGASWYDPTMDHLNAYIDSVNAKVTGTVKVKLYKGSITTVACESPYSLFDHNIATFNKNAQFNQNASAGFIEIHSLPQKMAQKVSVWTHLRH